MFYRLSNTTKLLDVENEFNRKFRYPNLYQPEAIINGLKETNVPIITSEEPDIIDYAIWGLLPEDYDDNWDTFQDITNTLNTTINDESLSENIYAEAFDKRRCLIIVNGFFTSQLLNGKLFPYHVHLKDHKPFGIAGVYNKINDGFLTCTLLTSNPGLHDDRIPNLGKLRPVILKKKDHNAWLDNNLTIKDLKSLIRFYEPYEFISHPVRESFYKNSKIFEHILDSDNYRTIMKISRKQ